MGMVSLDIDKIPDDFHEVKGDHEQLEAEGKGA
jgi:hypothetical protein